MAKVSNEVSKETLKERRRCLALCQELRDLMDATRVGFSRKKALSQVDLLMMHMRLGTRPNVEPGDE